MGFATISTVGGRPQRRRGQRRPRPYGVFSFIIAYLASIVVVLLSVIFAGPLAIFMYFVVGIALTRFIGNRVRWWKMTNSIENLATLKVRSVLTWPVSTPRFILAVALAKWL